jgi:hypothetical protein
MMVPPHGFRQWTGQAFKGLSGLVVWPSAPQQEAGGKSKPVESKKQRFVEEGEAGKGGAEEECGVLVESRYEKDDFNNDDAFGVRKG